jgi:hypothetical protein
VGAAAAAPPPPTTALSLTAEGPDLAGPTAGPPTATLDAGFRFNTVAALLHLARPYDPRLRLTLRTSLDGVTWEPWSTLPFIRSEGRPGTVRHPDDTASQPLWIGAARFIQYRIMLGGRPATPRTVQRLRFVFINTLDGGESPAQVESATQAEAAQTDTLAAASSRPAIVTRAGWGADESWRRHGPEYARVRMAFVHHTAGTTDYTREQAPAIVRAVYYYHDRVLGFSDIGYNFLIDRYGTIYEGRYGGIRRGVVGAQVLGFNSHSTGVSMMGTFDTNRPTPEMLNSLERLLVWKLSLTHRDPLGWARMLSAGADRYRAGVWARLRNISSHGEVGITGCPGKLMEARMWQVRRTAEAICHRRPKPLYVSAYAVPSKFTPNGDGLNDSTAIQCYAYTPQTVRVAVLDDSGAEVGLLQDWTEVGIGIWPVVWDGTLPGPGGPYTRSATYTVKVNAKDAAGHAATARTTVVVNATVSGLSVKPATFSPNSDGVMDTTVISYRLDKDAAPVITIGPKAAPYRTFTPGRQVAGPYQIVWDGLDDHGTAVPDGSWRVGIDAVDDTGRATTAGSVAIDRVHPRPVAPDPTLRVRRNVSIDVPYLVRDRSATSVRVQIVVTDSVGTIVRDSDRGWVTTGRTHTMSFKTSTPGVYTFTVTARDHAGNHEVTPAVIELRVR